MNDSTEMLYGWNVLKNNLEIFEKENKIFEKIRLSAFMKKVETSDLSEFFRQHFYHEKKTPFIISFSENKDVLNMWSLYGGNGKGVVLCFEEEELNGYLLLNTLYVNQSDNDIISAEVLSTIIPTEYEKYLKNTSKNDFDKIISIGSMLPLLSTYIKDSAFKYEREKRLSIICDNSKPVDFRVSKAGNIIPYIEVPIPIQSLKEIIIGPCINPVYVERGLLFELSVCGVDIPVSISNVPFREI